MSIDTDYSKALDRIDHNIPMTKLARIGIRGDLVRWFYPCINNRSQAVVINNYIYPVGLPYLMGSLKVQC